MNELTHLDLFSGIGGFSLGLESVGFRTVCFCEFDTERQRDLQHHWPTVPIVSDVNDVDAIGRALEESSSKRRHSRSAFKSRREGGQSFTTDAVKSPFILTAGVPCQPASTAGKRIGSADDRWLWPQTLRVVERFKPRWCVFENPLGIASLALPAAIPGVDITRLREVPGRTIAEILTGLAALGYELPCDRDGIPWIPVVPAAGIGAFHGRDRLFIIARRRDVGHAVSAGLQGRGRPECEHDQEGRQGEGRYGAEAGHSARANVGDAEGLQPRQGSEQRAGAGFTGAGCADEALRLPDWNDARIERGADGIHRAIKPGLRLLAHGIPRRISKLRGFGNAVCPQVIAQIGKAILESEGVKP